MPFSIPGWVPNTAIVLVIFSVGGYVARLEFELDTIDTEINEIKTKKVQELEKKIVAIETAMSIHHGHDWSEKAEKKALLKVGDLEEEVSNLTSGFDSVISRLSDFKKRITAINLWTRQNDALIKKDRLEQFRALAVYSTLETDNPNEIMVNKQHNRGANYKKGDSILLMNPLPPGLQVEVTVKGFLDDPKNPSVLVQINEKLLDDLGLSTKDGQYELFIQGKPDVLRWKTLDEYYEKRS